MKSRRPLLVLWLLTATAASAATTMYRSIGPNGEPVLSDRPSPGAVPVQVDVAPPVSGSSSGASGSAYASGKRVDDKEPFRYSSCEITNPANDQTFVNVQSVLVGGKLEPTQRPGDTVLLVLDGKRLEQANTLSWRLEPVFRGSHTVNLIVTDSRGLTICQSNGVTFHVRQPTILTPNPKGTVKKAPTTRRP